MLVQFEWLAGVSVNVCIGLQKCLKSRLESEPAHFCARLNLCVLPAVKAEREGVHLWSFTLVQYDREHAPLCRTVFIPH